MGLKLVTGPASEPVTTLEAKQQLSLAATVTTHDAMVGRMISAARAWTETYCGRAWINQTWRLTLSEFPACGEIWLPRAPLSSVTSITYVDSDGDTQTLSTDDYESDTSSEPGCVLRAHNVAWPVARNKKNAVTITYVAGFGDESAEVPQDARHAILMQVAHLFQHRETAMETALHETPMAVKTFLDSYRVGVVPGGYDLE